MCVCVFFVFLGGVFFLVDGLGFRGYSYFSFFLLVFARVPAKKFGFGAQEFRVWGFGTRSSAMKMKGLGLRGLGVEGLRGLRV